MRSFSTNLFLLVLTGTCIIKQAGAQAGSYALSANLGIYNPVSGTSITMTSDGTTPGFPYDNGYANNIPVGFNFFYLGNYYSDVSVSTNGFVGLTQSLSSYPMNSLATAGIPTPRPILAPLWDDLNLNAASNIQYLTSGAVGSRVFVVQWSNVFWDKNASSAAISFQLRLYETTGVIEFVYNRLPGSVSAASGGASIGITNLLGGSGNFISLTNSSSAPGTSSVTETSNINVLPATGQIYRFTPVVCDLPTVAIGSATANSVNFSWLPVSGATGYQWAVTQSPTPPLSGTFTAGTTVNVTGLTANQVYYVHVTTICGAYYSGWTTISFSTLFNDVPCDALNLVYGAPPLCSDATFASSGGEPSTYCFNEVTNTVWYKYTPVTSGFTILKFTRDGLPPAQFNGLAVIFKASGTCPFLTLTPPSAGNCIGLVNLNTNPYVELETNALTAGTTYYFMIRGTGKFCLQLPCTYNIAPAIATSGLAIPGGQVNFSWAPVVSATSYNLHVTNNTNNTSTVTNVTGTSATLSGINYSSYYTWHVVPVYVSGTTGSCSVTRTFFSTAAAPVNCMPLTSLGCLAGDSLSYFSLKGASGTFIYNNSGSTCNPQAYSDYTGVFAPVELVVGESFSGFIRTGNSNDYFTLWIDYNDDGFFSSTERLVNNMRAGPATKHFTLFIPHPGVPFAGTHRMRVRVVNYSTAPFIHNLTDPCNPYTYGETEDYLVTMSSTSTTRQVATGTPNTCTETNIVIDQHSNNISGQVFLVDSSNQYIAAISPGGNNLGTVQASFYINNGPVRQDITGRYYLDRNLTVNTSIPPASLYQFRYYYKTAELNALIAQPGSGVTSQFDLVMTKSTFPNCISGYNGSATLYAPASFGTLSGDLFVNFTGLSSFSSFYLHGGAAVLLPAELLRFSVQREGNNNLLKWTTATEQNNRGFGVQRSADGIHFTTFAFVASQAPGGNSTDALDYTCTDILPAGTKQFYRLQQSDIDGKIRYSQVVVMNRERASGWGIQFIYPNPVKDKLFVSISAGKSSLVAFELVSLSGIVVKRWTAILNEGVNTIQADTRSLASGIYYLKAMSNGNRSVAKVVIQ